MSRVADNSKVIGFIGVGVMGGPMARRLLERGHQLIVHDNDSRAMNRLIKSGARVARNAREVADRAQTVLVSLPTPPIVREVALGAAGVVRGRAVRTFVDLSTTGSVVEKEVANILAARKIETVDAPVSGGARGAVFGTLAVMAAGKPRAIARVRHLLEIFGTVFIVGNQPGQAQILKLLNNLLSSTAFAITAEAFVAGVKAGLDPDVMLAAINAGSGRSSASQDKFPKSVLPRTFDFGFPISGVCKDAELALSECQALGVPMWLGSAARQLWQFAYSQGGAKRDMTSLITYIESWAGVQVRSRSTRKRGTT